MLLSCPRELLNVDYSEDGFNDCGEGESSQSGQGPASTGALESVREWRERDGSEYGSNEDESIRPTPCGGTPGDGSRDLLGIV
jgi:hypothetical protein